MDRAFISMTQWGNIKNVLIYLYSDMCYQMLKCLYKSDNYLAISIKMPTFASAN